MNIDLEYLRQAFSDVKQHVGIGVIMQVGMSKDFTVFRTQISMLPEEREIIAYASFSDPYEVTLPQVGDLVLVGFADGDPNEAHIIARFPQEGMPIPKFARDGHSVKYARPKKKLYLGSDKKIGIGKPDTEQTEPLVLGTVLVNGLTDLVNAFLNAPEIGLCAVGPVFLDPGVRIALTTFIQTYLTVPSTNIVSQIAYTERGE